MPPAVASAAEPRHSAVVPGRAAPEAVRGERGRDILTIGARATDPHEHGVPRRAPRRRPSAPTSITMPPSFVERPLTPWPARCAAPSATGRDAPSRTGTASTTSPASARAAQHRVPGDATAQVVGAHGSGTRGRPGSTAAVAGARLRAPNGSRCGRPERSARARTARRAAARHRCRGRPAPRPRPPHRRAPTSLGEPLQHRRVVRREDERADAVARARARACAPTGTLRRCSAGGGSRAGRVPRPSRPRRSRRSRVRGRRARGRPREGSQPSPMRPMSRCILGFVAPTQIGMSCAGAGPRFAPSTWWNSPSTRSGVRSSTFQMPRMIAIASSSACTASPGARRCAAHRVDRVPEAAGTEREVEAAATEQINGCRGARQHRRLPQRHVQHVAAQVHALGAGGHVAQQRPRVVEAQAGTDDPGT